MNIAVPSRPQESPRPHSRSRVLLIAAAIGFLFAIWCMRGAHATDVTFYDQARHAMNGAAIHDMVRDGGFTSPAAYLKEYFTRYPAISMPYHPPLFPAVEAIFFAAFGVSQVTARATVAVFVAGVSALLVMLVYSTHGSLRVAAASTIIFMAIPLSQSLAADVMLEMPAMFFVLGSLLFMRSLPTWDTRQAIAAACFAAAAVWTKQVVFAGLVPFLMICVTRRWSLIRRAPFWLFTAIFGTSVLAVRLLWAYAGLTGSARNWAEIGLLDRIVRNGLFYASLTRDARIAVPLVLLVAYAAFHGHKTGWRNVTQILHPLYLCWIVAIIAVLLIVPPFDVRYLWFAAPPAVTLVTAAADRALRHTMASYASAWIVPAAALLFFIVNMRTTLPALTGPSEAARLLASHRPDRVLVAGANNGSVIFSLRSQYPGSDIIVIRADKLPAQTFETAAIEEFAHTFGIKAMVVEWAARPTRWQRLATSPSPNMRLERVIPQRSSDSEWTGSILIYRFLNPSQSPRSILRIRIASTGREMELSY